MHRKISPCFLIPFVIAFIITGSFTQTSAAEFTADIVISGPADNDTFKLHVRDTMYRLEKIQGALNIPPYPTIVNGDTGVTWGLNPDSRRYVEIRDIEKTVMVNPLIGWAATRKNFVEKAGPAENLNGYLCETWIYTEPGKSETVGKVWFSKKLRHILREERYGLNQNPVLELKNIQEGPVDPALFEIPEGYTKLDMDADQGAKPSGDAPKHITKSSAASMKPKVETIEIRKGSGRGQSLEPDRRIVVTATGDSPEGGISKAGLTVHDRNKNVIESARFALQNNQTRSWEIPPEMEPWTLSLSGEEGRVVFKVEQFAAETEAQPAESRDFETPATPEHGPDRTTATPQPTVKSPQNEDLGKPAPSVAPSGNLVFILDASGSMWGQVEGKAKIAIAKEVLTDLINEFPDDAVVGLVAYGHRRKGDCDDVEELVSPGKIDKSKLISTIQGLSPKGKTPISRSVRMTADGIRHLEDETTIILVSDGKETCDPDPCGLVKELKAAGIKFIMHVIGFDVTEEEKSQLECMAQAGGGGYFTAKTAKEFQMAAQEVVHKAQKPYGVLRMTVMKNGKPFFTPIRVLRAVSGERVFDSSSSGETGVRDIRLDPGTYHVEVRDISVSGGKTPEITLRDIVIEAGEIVERSADFSDGTLIITALRNKAPCKVTAFYYRQGEKKAFVNLQTHPKSGKISRRLLPGPYRIEVVDSSIAGSPSVVFDPLEIPPGGTVEKSAEFFAGDLTVAATLNGEPYNTPFEVYNDSGEKISSAWTQGRVNGQRLVRLQAGTYTIKVRSTRDAKQVQAFENVTIETGGAKTITAAFPLEHAAPEPHP